MLYYIAVLWSLLNQNYKHDNGPEFLHVQTSVAIMGVRNCLRNAACIHQKALPVRWVLNRQSLYQTDAVVTSHSQET